VRYSYILEGYDNDWQDTWETEACYEKLPVGEYMFRVIAINRDLVVSESPATLKLTVVPDPRDQQIAELESELELRNRELEAELQDARRIQLRHTMLMDACMASRGSSSKSSPASHLI
jgi:hypothetical protein